MSNGKAKHKGDGPDLKALGREAQHTEWTDAAVKKVCKLIRETGMSQKMACERYGLKPGTLTRYTQGEEPRYPGWSVMVRQAKAERCEKLMRRLNEPGLLNPEVKAILSQLRTLDPRYREDSVDQTKGFQVNFLVGQVGDPGPKFAEATLLEGPSPLLEAPSEDA